MKKERKEPEMVKAYDFLDEKRFNIGKIIFDVIICLVVLILLFTWVFDFINVYNKKTPTFCLKNKTYEYKTGTIDECIGLGYKVYIYKHNTKSEKFEFVPLFIEKNKNYMK